MKRVTSNKPISFRHHSLSSSPSSPSFFFSRPCNVNSPSPLKQSLSIIFPFLSPDGELYENSAIFIRPKLTRRMVKQRSTRALNMLICVIALAGIFEWGEGGNGAREERENSNFPRRVSRIKPGPGIATFRPITLIRS